MFSLICIWINGWVNNRKAGDLRRYRIHYDVTVMFPVFTPSVSTKSECFLIRILYLLQINPFDFGTARLLCMRLFDKTRKCIQHNNVKRQNMGEILNLQRVHNSSFHTNCPLLNLISNECSNNAFRSALYQHFIPWSRYCINDVLNGYNCQYWPEWLLPYCFIGPQWDK